MVSKLFCRRLGGPVPRSPAKRWQTAFRNAAGSAGRSTTAVRTASSVTPSPSSLHSLPTKLPHCTCGIPASLSSDLPAFQSSPFDHLPASLARTRDDAVASVPLGTEYEDEVEDEEPSPKGAWVKIIHPDLHQNVPSFHDVDGHTRL